MLRLLGLGAFIAESPVRIYDIITALRVDAAFKPRRGEGFHTGEVGLI